MNNIKQDYATFKMEVVRWRADKFMALPPFFRNRDVEGRVPKMVSRLEKGALPTHLNVAIGKAVAPFGPYEKGDYFRLDGHTRTDAWKVNPDLIPNVPLFVTIYEIGSYNEAMAIYGDIDSAESVETTNQKMTGILRENNYSAQSKVNREGKFITAIKDASSIITTPEGIFLGGKGVHPKTRLDYFWNEFTYLDSLNLDDFDRFTKRIYTTFLLLTKKYGTKNKHLRTLIENYRSGITTISTETEVDGVHYVYYTLYDEYKGKGWNEMGVKDLTIKILYVFEKFMNDKTIAKRSKLPDMKKLKEFYQEYL
jgi:hypothetical protein